MRARCWCFSLYEDSVVQRNVIFAIFERQTNTEMDSVQRLMRPPAVEDHMITQVKQF